MSVDEWVAKSVVLPDGVYVCLECGEINTYYKYVCRKCEAKGEAMADPIDITKGGSLE
jgi:ribosomal protein L40E